MIALASSIHYTLVGALIALFISASIAATLWWMLHPPESYVQKIAAEAESELGRMVGSVIVVFSPEIDSAHMMALAVKLAKGERSSLLAVYVIEVPYTLPPHAEMPTEERHALDALGAAEEIAGKSNMDIHTETLKARSTSQAVLDIAKRQKANLIIMGSFREDKYAGAPLGRAIEAIAANARCDVLIGIEGEHGMLMVDESGMRDQAGRSSPDA